MTAVNEITLLDLINALRDLPFAGNPTLVFNRYGTGFDIYQPNGGYCGRYEFRSKSLVSDISPRTRNARTKARKLSLELREKAALNMDRRLDIHRPEGA